MKKARAVLEFFKSIVLLVLVVSMVGLASMYIASTQSERLDFGNDINFDRLFNVKGDGSGFNFNYVLPEIIGIKKSGEAPKAMIGNSAYISDMYKMLTPCLADMFGENGVCEKLADDEADALWREYLFAPTYTYLRYHTQYPFSVLYVHCDNTDENDLYASSESGEAYVYEIVLTEDALVTRDEDGNVMKFTDKNGAKLILPEFGRYMSRLTEYFFAGESREFSSLYYGTPIFKNGIITKKVSSDSLVMSEFGNTSGEKFRGLMKTFDYNPDKLNSYIDAEERNASMYVESHGVLKITDLKIEYTASADGGISIVDFLNYHTGSSGYDPYDYLRASERLVDALKKISPAAFGGDASLGISYIGYSDGVFVVEYSYYFENLLICRGEDDVAFRIEIADDKISYVLINPISVTYAESSARAFSQKIALDIGLDKYSGVPSDRLSMGLSYNVFGAVDVQASAEWKVIKK